LSSLNSFSLILECGEYWFNEIQLCSGTINVIVNFERHFENEELEKIMNCLDFNYGLFNDYIRDWNKIISILKMFHDNFHLISDKKWEGLYAWLPLHKRCGACIKLVLNTELKENIQEELILPKKELLSAC
jgi:hypothetical protein